MMSFNACKKILPKFKTISKDIWGNVVDNIEIKCERKTEKTHHLASLSRPATCTPLAIDGHLLRYCREYTLQLSPRIQELSEKKLTRILKHEALHMGYSRHTRDFLDIASKIGAPFSEFSIEKNVIAIEAKSNGRYKTIMTATTPYDAEKMAREYARNNPEQRVRITY